MQNKRKKRWFFFLTFAFVLTNSLLIFFDREDKVEQKSYINDWSEAFTYDLVETLSTDGVFAATESNPIYFDDSVGYFQKFLVEKGDEVREGDDLYEYEVIDYHTQQSSLESDISRLEEEINAIESYLTEMESYEVPEPDNSEDSSILTPDEEGDENSPAYTETEFMKEQTIAEKEMELAQKEAMLDMVESQLDDLESEGQIITVQSPFNGVITDVSEELDSPIITMKTTTLQVEGVLEEAERKRVKEDMNAEITIPEEEELQLKGKVSSVARFPENVSVNQDSEYPFVVSIEEDLAEMLPGYHVAVSIITDRADEAVTAFAPLLATEENLFAWVMDDTGKLVRRAIKTGIEVDGLVEVIEGLEPGEMLAHTPHDQFRRGATFFTPIQSNELRLKETFAIDSQTMLSYGLMGLMAR
ncbi:efflux RND transporter periplasmic adaptor subunit [Thalassobacillus devorans]|uniref:efflux RND transporter periplasmic adaptor subunit n=1 Tax=Thalassobacillus devorans TaxID=279813 RepID=UPI00048C08B1|nr:efflux RND transporter periplasmic adaptor subunit [Thalassobacillus devorans]